MNITNISKARLAAYVAVGLLALVVVWYAVGGVAGWLDSRAARNEAAAQKAIAEQAAQEAAAAKADSLRINDELQREKGRAAALEQRNRELEQERTELVTALDDAREATAGARQRYETVRRAPTRRPPAPPDLDRQRRERELCKLYPDDERCAR